MSTPRALDGRVLVVAGSDSGGGAGIQADIKTITALGGYAETAVTALTAQDTTGVHGVLGVDPAFIAQQIRVVLRDLGADAVKTGMLHTPAVIETVAATLVDEAPMLPLVVDPVMIAKGGHALLQNNAVDSLTTRLIPLAAVATPNLPEAAALAQMEVNDVDAMIRAGKAILALGAKAVLVKGGHLEDDTVTDVLVTSAAVERFSGPRIRSRHTHGTGCTLASAIAAGLAQKRSLIDAVVRARAYVRVAIAGAPGYGRGHGPLNHAHTVAPFAAGPEDACPT